MFIKSSLYLNLQLAYEIEYQMVRFENNIQLFRNRNVLLNFCIIFDIV